MNPYLDGPFATSAFHLLTIIDFLCLAAGTYLLLILHDIERRIGYLLTAIALTVLALRIVSSQLTMGEPLLHYVGSTLSMTIAAIVLAWGTLSLVDASESRQDRGTVRRLLLTVAALAAVLGTAAVWALPFWDELRELVTRATADGGFVNFMNGLRVAVAAALAACTWITWERRVLGPELSRMFGAAYLLWSGAIIVGILPIWVPASSYWIREIVWVLGSLFIGNALAVHVYRAERRALERQKRLRLVDRVATAAISAPRLLPIIEALSNEVSELVDTRLVATYLRDSEDTRVLELFYRVGDSEIELAQTVDSSSRHAIARSLREGEATPFTLQIGEDSDAEAVAIPLIALNEGVGVLIVVLAPGAVLSEADLTALTNAGTQLGVIVQHMILLEDTRQARDRWKQTFDSLTELVSVHDREGRIVLANSALLDFVGGTEVEVIGNTVCELLGECDDDEETLQKCIRTGEALETQMQRTRGRIHQVQVTPLREYDGTVTGCVRVARDVTSRWRAEEHLAQSERRYRELAESANDVIYTHDLAGNFLYVNPAAVRILGYTQEQFTHLSFWDIVAAESLARAKAYVNQLLAGESPEEQVELRMVCADERFVVVQLRGNVVRREGRSEAIHGIARDVTAEKQLAAQLIQADRLASVGTLIAGIAHELNNPLTTIGGYADVLSERLAGTEAEEGIRTIAEESERCRAVAQGLLNFARQDEEDTNHFDLNALIRGIFDLRAYDLRAAEIVLKADLAQDLQQVVGEYGQIQQVVYNLIDNAYYALQQQYGGVLEISTRNNREGVVIEVADDGEGIPESIRDQVFEPFVTSKPRGEGTGLGLSICRRILERHGGTISAHDREERGVVFRVTLPAAGPAPVTDIEMVEDQSPAPEEEIREAIRLLFIDDEPSLRNLVTEFMQRKGHDVTVAATGEEGLSMALEDDFDAIVCDMRLPGINGDEVCSRLLQERPDLSKRIMVATGDVLSPQVQEFFDQTRLHHIHKPFKLAELETDVVHLATSRKQPQD